MDKIEKTRKDTYLDLKSKLSQYNKCCLIRPTGFGKTWTLSSMTREYRKVLYIYPTVAIRNTVVDVLCSSDDQIGDIDTIELAKNMKSFGNVDMMTYAKLQSLGESEISQLPDYDLIIFDEAHVMGATNTIVATHKMLKRFESSAHIIGATATPNRMDGFDVVGEFFNNVVVYPYTFHDAFQDKLLQKPVYYYCPYDLNQIRKNLNRDVSEKLFDAGIDKSVVDRPEIHHLIKSSILHLANIFNMDTVLYNGISKHIKGTYYKFICFFSSIDKIEDEGQEVVSWFKSAFPDYTIHTLNIHSRTHEAAENVNKLNDFKYAEHTIDLVFCVDMINVGYHVNDLTGIIMGRGTKSNIVYIQQFGRALSSGDETPSIIFDVVDNIHRKALYETQTKRVKSSRVVNPTSEVLESLTEEQLEKYMSDSQATIERHNEEYVVIGRSEYYNTTTGQLDYAWWRDANKIEPEDLYVDGYEATYKEIIAKVVAEPISQLCREAVNLHFKRWCRDNQISYPITHKQLKEMYGISEDEWRNDFKHIIETHGLDYPWQDASKLMNCTAVPFEVFAREKQVSIPRILELLGVA